MKLKKLIKDIPLPQVKGSKEIEITGICANSKLVAPGNLFIAKKGLTEDGAAYIPEAVAAGAVAVLTDIYDPFLKSEVTQLIHPNVSSLEGMIADHYYQFPSSELYMVGLTGTNGKTTASFLIKHILESINSPTGLIGTIEYIIGRSRYPATHTTPDVSTNHKYLREMLLQGCKSAIMEITSHGIDQGRVQNIDFDAAVFTNLSLDHLDYHHTMQAYAAAKNKLFRGLNPAIVKSHSYPKIAIVNSDSSWHQDIAAGCKAPLFTYGLSPSADLSAKDICLDPFQTTFTLCHQGTQASCHLPLAGRFNVYNCLAAMAVGLSRGISLEQLCDIIATAPSIAGRLETVANPLGLNIYVDFAHTDDALANVLQTLREFKKQRIVVVFGCGGDRDASKRPKMASVAEELADITIVTSDNPRTEAPHEIARQVALGFKNPQHHIIELDRRAAIQRAIDLATPDDIILIAGKGHETSQIFAHKTLEFDDRKVAQEICHHKASLT